MIKNCYWQQEVTVPNQAAPKKDTYDVVVLGGGFAGLSAARYIKKRDPSLSVCILESDYVGFGASGRNGGFAMTLLGLNGAQLLRDQKLEKAREGHRFMKDSVQHVRELIKEYKIDCEAVDEGFMTVALNSVQDKRILHEIECYKKLGTEMPHLDSKKIREILPSSKRITSGLLDPNAIMLHPFKLARALKKVAEELGIEVCEGFGAAGYERNQNGGYTVEVSQKEGTSRPIKTKKLVITTNAYAYRLGLFKAGLIPIYTYLVGTEPLTKEQWEQIGWAKRNGIESAFRLVHYMRPTQDGRILLGGKSARYFFGHTTAAKYDQNEGLFQALREDLVKFFPALQGIKFTHAWGGPIASTLSFFPTIGCDAKEPDLLWALGCCGHGVSTMNHIGSVVADLMFENKSPNTELFFVNKKPWSLLPPEPFKYIGAGTYKNAMWWLDRADEARAGTFF
jgi:glycine/D-amino acid oxidase-like deaminating enzyme